MFSCVIYGDDESITTLDTLLLFTTGVLWSAGDVGRGRAAPAGGDPPHQPDAAPALGRHPLLPGPRLTPAAHQVVQERQPSGQPQQPPHRQALRISPH